VIAPDGTHYTNSNPSGNQEWELFRISTDPFDSTQMDYHADSLPAGIYQVFTDGVDLGNGNAWRFSHGVLGVTSTETPQPWTEADSMKGVIAGSVYYDTDTSGTRHTGEAGIPTVNLTAFADYNADTVIDDTLHAQTNDFGEYRFSKLRVGTYIVKVDTTTLPDTVRPTGDYDGLTTLHSATATIKKDTIARTVPFGYEQLLPPCAHDRGYWATHPENWPVDTVKIGGVIYRRIQLMAILQHAASADKTYELAAEMVAAKLNLSAGALGTCSIASVADGDAWLASYLLGSGVGQSGSAWTAGASIYSTLRNFNRNGCAPGA
jgi:hypothetical protein